MQLSTTSNMQYMGSQSYTLFPALPLKYLIYSIFSSPGENAVVSQSLFTQRIREASLFIPPHTGNREVVDPPFLEVAKANLCGTWATWFNEM